MLFQVNAGQVIKEHEYGHAPQVKEEQTRYDPERRVLIDIHVFLFLQEKIEVRATDHQDSQRGNTVAAYSIFSKVRDNTVIYPDTAEQQQEWHNDIADLEIIPAKQVQDIELEKCFQRQVNVIHPMVNYIGDQQHITYCFNHHR
jgi:hypothetical protein